MARIRPRIGNAHGGGGDVHVPENLVKADAKKPGTPWHVTLGGDGLPEVILGPYENPATAEQDAAKIREFLAALLADK